jgi:hypothetical protein
MLPEAGLDGEPFEEDPVRPSASQMSIAGRAADSAVVYRLVEVDAKLRHPSRRRTKQQRLAYATQRKLHKRK